jgi:hypothetical protein
MDFKNISVFVSQNKLNIFTQLILLISLVWLAVMSFSNINLVNERIFLEIRDVILMDIALNFAIFVAVFLGLAVIFENIRKYKFIFLLPLFLIPTLTLATIYYFPNLAFNVAFYFIIFVIVFLFIGMIFQSVVSNSRATKGIFNRKVALVIISAGQIFLYSLMGQLPIFIATVLKAGLIPVLYFYFFFFFEMFRLWNLTSKIEGNIYERDPMKFVRIIHFPVYLAIVIGLSLIFSIIVQAVISDQTLSITLRMLSTLILLAFWPIVKIGCDYFDFKRKMEGEQVYSNPKLFADSQEKVADFKASGRWSTEKKK